MQNIHAVLPGMSDAEAQARYDEYMAEKNAQEDINAEKADRFTKEKDGSKLGAAVDSDMALPRELIITDRQFGKKVGKHAQDFGLDTTNRLDREKFRGIITEIVSNPDEIRVGKWRSQDGMVLFYIKGDNVVVASQSGEYITTLTGGVDNARVKNTGKY